MVKLYQPLSTRYHEMNTSEIYANIPILNTNDLFKNGFLFGLGPGFHIYCITGGCLTC